jgi:hypothetical protein
MPEWVVDVDNGTAQLDLSSPANLSLSKSDSLLQQLVHYHDEGDIAHVVITVRPNTARQSKC